MDAKIKQMAYDLAKAEHWDLDEEAALFVLDRNKTAAHLCKMGYSKRSEGEWIPSDIPQEKYVCSVCGGACWYYDYQGDVAKSRYCPNRGAKMRKEDEGK